MHPTAGLLEQDRLLLNVLSVTDTQSNVYVQAGNEVTADGQGVDIFYAKNIQGGANSVTGNFTGAVSGIGLYIHEYSGLDTSFPLDVTATNTGTSANLDSGRAATNFANELIFGFGVEQAGVVSIPGAGFKARANYNGNLTEDEVVSAVGTYDATETGDGNTWKMMMATFRASNSPSNLMSNTGASTATGRVKYRLSVPSSLARGDVHDRHHLHPHPDVLMQQSESTPLY